MAETNPARWIEYFQFGGLILVCGAAVAGGLSVVLEPGASSNASFELLGFLLVPSLPAIGALAAWTARRRHAAAVLLVLTGGVSGLALVWLVVVAVHEFYGVDPNGNACSGGGNCGPTDGGNHAFLLLAGSTVFSSVMGAALLKGWGSRAKPTS